MRRPGSVWLVRQTSVTSVEGHEIYVGLWSDGTLEFALEQVSGQTPAAKELIVLDAQEATDRKSLELAPGISLDQDTLEWLDQWWIAEPPGWN